jgi:hypothetical protein
VIKIAGGGLEQGELWGWVGEGLLTVLLQHIVYTPTRKIVHSSVLKNRKLPVIYAMQIKANTSPGRPKTLAINKSLSLK